MKKTIITLTAVVLFMQIASAQKVQVGLTGGASVSNFKFESDEDDENGDAKTGVTFGVLANIPAGKNFMVQTGAHWVQKGTKMEESIGGSTEKISLVTNWIEVPVNFLYNSGGFFIGAGPSFSFAVSGKWKLEFDGEKETEDVKFGDSNDDDDMKGFDLGANVQTGYRFPNGFLIMANYNQGLSNLAVSGADNDKLKSHYFGIRLGYLLNGKNN